MGVCNDSFLMHMFFTVNMACTENIQCPTVISSSAVYILDAHYIAGQPVTQLHLSLTNSLCTVTIKFMQPCRDLAINFIHAFYIILRLIAAKHVHICLSVLLVYRAVHATCTCLQLVKSDE